MKSGKHVRQSGKQFWKGGNEAGKSEKHAGSSGNLLWESGNPPGNSEEQLSESGRRVEKTGNRVEANEKQVGKSGNGVEKSGDPLFDSGKELFKSAKRLFGNADPLLINQNELSKGEIDVEQRKEEDIEETSKTINPRRPKMKKKITTELLQFKKLDQICDFGVANAHRFAPGTPGAEVLAALRSTVSNLKVLTAAQASLE